MNRRDTRTCTSILAVTALACGLIALPTYADDSQQAPVEQPEDLSLVNPSFEDSISEDGEVPGWTGQWLGETVWIEVSSEQASDGEHSLLFVDEDDARGGAVVSDPIEINAGHQYQMTTDLFAVSG